MFAAPRVRVGSPLSHGRLTVFPLFAEAAAPTGYRLSDEALADGTAVVEEVSESGNVPHLSVENKGDTPILFLEGQELRGAKQNRVLNTSVLIAAHTKTVLPVSCVEQGRWRYTSKNFAASGSHSSTKLRTVLKASTTMSAKAGRGHSSDQGEVWREVGRQMASHGASSETMAMADTFTAREDVVKEHVDRLGYAEGAAGLVVAAGGKVVAVDLFDHPETCKKVWPRLLTGAVMDSLEAEEGSAPDPATVDEVLTAFAGQTWEPVPAVGLGEEYRADAADRWHGSVLAHDGSVVHGSLVMNG